MTWNQVLAYGQAAGLAFRVSVEGLLVDWVTHPEMIMTSPDSEGRTRRVGLEFEGTISQNVDIAACTVEASGLTFKVADVAEIATSVFSAEPQETWMGPGSINATDTTLVVRSTSGFDSGGGYLWIDTEVMSYTHVGTTTIDGVLYGTFEGLGRGELGTLAQYHYSADLASSSEDLRYPSVTNAATSIEGRRVYLYVYDRGDPYQGDGQQVFLGVVLNDARMTGPGWSFSADTIARVLEAEVGSDLGESRPRGIYYPPITDSSDPYPFQFYIYRIVGTVPGDPVEVFPQASKFSTTPAGTIYLPHPSYNSGSGFFEEQAGDAPSADVSVSCSFLEAVQGQLDTLTSSWNTQISVAETVDGSSWYFVATTGATSGSLCDGVAITNVNRNGVDPLFDTLTVNENPEFVEGETADVSQYPGRVYYFHAHFDTAEGAGTVPRGSFAPFGSAVIPTAAQENRARVYLDGSTVLTGAVDNAKVAVEGSDDAYYDVYGSPDLLLRSIVLQGSVAPVTFNSLTLPTINFSRTYDAVSNTGTYALLKAIELGCPEFVNLGIMPVIRAGDWTGELPTGEWFSEYANPDTPELAKKRRYTIYKPIKLIELIAPDLQLMGAYLAFDSSGRLTIKRLTATLESEAPVLRLTESNLIMSEGFPSYEKIPYGTTNTYVLREGYDPIEDKWTAVPIMVRDVAAFGRQPLAKALEVKPKSLYTGDSTEIDRGVVAAAAGRILTVFGAPYAVISCSAPLTAFEVVLGSVVSVDTRQLPQAGVRGLNAKGRIISREIDIMAGRIDLTILVSLSSYVGYAPSAMVESESLVSGTTWDITLESDYFRSGDVAADHYVEGDNVVAYVFDDETTAGVYGTVAAGSFGNVVRVTFVGTWTPGASDWILAFSSLGPETSSMKQYGYGAGSDLRIDWSAPARSAFKFSVSAF